jgi:hypothetical protein
LTPEIIPNPEILAQIQNFLRQKFTAWAGSNKIDFPLTSQESMVDKFWLRFTEIMETPLKIFCLHEFEVCIKNYWATPQNLNIIWGYNKDPKLIFIGKCNQKIYLNPREQKTIKFTAMPLQGGFVKLPKVKLQVKQDPSSQILPKELDILKVDHNTPRGRRIATP